MERDVLLHNANFLMLVVVFRGVMVIMLAIGRNSQVHTRLRAMDF
jgi:hypothetical protein